jgi:hypothetical protein
MDHRILFSHETTSILSRAREESLRTILLWHDTEEVLTMAVYKKRDNDEGTSCWVLRILLWFLATASASASALDPS